MLSLVYWIFHGCVLEWEDIFIKRSHLEGKKIFCKGGCFFFCREILIWGMFKFVCVFFFFKSLVVYLVFNVACTFCQRSEKNPRTPRICSEPRLTCNKTHSWNVFLFYSFYCIVLCFIVLYCILRCNNKDIIITRTTMTHDVISLALSLCKSTPLRGSNNCPEHGAMLPTFKENCQPWVQAGLSTLNGSLFS